MSRLCHEHRQPPRHHQTHSPTTRIRIIPPRKQPPAKAAHRILKHPSPHLSRPRSRCRLRPHSTSSAALPALHKKTSNIAATPLSLQEECVFLNCSAKRPKSWENPRVLSTTSFNKPLTRLGSPPMKQTGHRKTIPTTPTEIARYYFNYSNYFNYHFN